MGSACWCWWLPQLLGAALTQVPSLVSEPLRGIVVVGGSLPLWAPGGGFRAWSLASQGCWEPPELRESAPSRQRWPERDPVPLREQGPTEPVSSLCPEDPQPPAWEQGLCGGLLVPSGRRAAHSQRQLWL